MRWEHALRKKPNHRFHNGLDSPTSLSLVPVFFWTNFTHFTTGRLTVNTLKLFSLLIAATVMGFTLGCGSDSSTSQTPQGAFDEFAEENPAPPTVPVADE
ncbi:hypothetical protein GCM10023156_09520 [Novipirellula rosea]|uniref:Uncharacterized protein n=1 Tax=Novipirellula rosea TaxID=1031540 RepID=A0ABP8MER4_9BACT